MGVYKTSLFKRPKWVALSLLKLVFIKDNKCSWLVVQALMNCSSDQKSVLQLHYGKNREDDILKIKELYDDLHLKEKFSEFEEKSYSKINKLINSYSGPLHKNTFNAITEKLYRRQN